LEDALSASEWAGDGVDVAQIVSALGRLRARDEGEGEMRASIMNLVAWSADGASAPDLEAVIAGLADHQPSRALILAPGPDPDGIDARVRVYSRPAAAANHPAVRLEQVTLRLRGAVADHAASVVIPLLRTDLPTFLWWPGAPEPGEPTYAGLAGVADRVVTEAGRAVDSVAALDRLAEAIAGPGGPALTDLAWASLTPWRQLLAQVTGPRPAARLGTGPAVVEVVHGEGEPSLEARLLAAWLTEAVEGESEVRLLAADGEDARLVAMRLFCGDALVAVERIPGRATGSVTVQGHGEEPRTRILPLPAPRREALLAGELELTRRDRPFERAVGLARRLAAEGQPPGRERSSVRVRPS
jgi:hypothetical protein